MDGIYCQGFADRDALIGELTMKAKSLQTDNAKLRAELGRLRKMSTAEMMCENESVKQHVVEWENRCLKAEAELAAAREEILRLQREVVARNQKALDGEKVTALADKIFYANDKLRALCRIAGTCGVCASRSYMRCPVVDESMKPEYAGLFPREAERGDDERPPIDSDDM